MRRAAEVWPIEADFVQQVAAQIPWGHVVVLLDRRDVRPELPTAGHRPE